jgi:hypothetical protein
MLGGVFAVALAGCSGEKTLVAEGDPAARRKAKDEALNKMLNPDGKAPAKGKGRPKSAKEKAVDEMYLP